MIDLPLRWGVGGGMGDFVKREGEIPLVGDDFQNGRLISLYHRKEMNRKETRSRNFR